MIYSTLQQNLLKKTSDKVKQFFDQFPVPVHGLDHALQVAFFAREIALEEKIQNVFLCELSGLLHDIGRVPEKYTPGNTKTHHELSYELLRQWFQEDKTFGVLSAEEKVELLYAIRYHWCDGADEYMSALVLRDADKLDMFGTRGFGRMIEWHKDPDKIEKGLRMAYYCHYWLRTETAKRMVKEKKMMVPHDEWLREYLQGKIEPIEL